MQSTDIIKHEARWFVSRFANEHAFRGDKPFSVTSFKGNVLLNEGITALQNLLTGAAETPFNNGNSYLGVGDNSNGEANSQTGLLGANKTYKAMEATYPTISGQKTTWRSVFGANDANYPWQEFTVASGNNDSADNLNRKVSNQSTKVAGQVWTLDLEVTWS